MNDNINMNTDHICNKKARKAKKEMDKSLQIEKCSATLSAVHISPQKMCFIARLARGKKADFAVQLLAICPKKGAIILKKLIESAIANGISKSFRIEDLWVNEILVDKSITLKRIMPRARGRANRITKRYSTIVVNLGLKKTNKPINKKIILEKDEVQIQDIRREE
jgi:large subunit ribosomal protein L22